MKLADLGRICVAAGTMMLRAPELHDAGDHEAGALMVGAAGKLLLTGAAKVYGADQLKKLMGRLQPADPPATESGPDLSTGGSCPPADSSDSSPPNDTRKL